MKTIRGAINASSGVRGDPGIIPPPPLVLARGDDPPEPPDVRGSAPHSPPRVVVGGGAILFTALLSMTRGELWEQRRCRVGGSGGLHEDTVTFSRPGASCGDCPVPDY
ncbi:hypothetical protein Airi01_099410 [Actinoallomurus iriomotensis]|uniref:Uncharacterized protein n=1 Tax=Actinoallomurus iriomotensis TaxID=478107 RepID=A0A9W6RUA0_9ACTN|nr:hypothetical protein Airi01_099410 [Actinoallomurus iriomotensis]